MEKKKLKDIELEEVSLVDLAANKRKFLFFKRVKSDDKDHADSRIVKQGDLKLLIESDGTSAGTKILVNGEEIENLDSFYFSYYKPWGVKLDSKEGPTISCSYSKVVEAEGGFRRDEMYHLAKGEHKMNEELKELIKQLLGDDFNAEEFEKQAELSDEVVKAIKEALKLVTKYKGDFPDDLKSAIAVLVKYAGYGYGYPEMGKGKDGDKDGDVEKSGKKLSKETLEKILAAIKALQSTLPADSKLEKLDTVDKDALKEVKDIFEKIAESTKQGDDKLKSLTDSLSEVVKRLEVIENSKGIKKSIQDQDGDGNGDDKDKQKGAGKDGKVLWPSIVNAGKKEE